MEMNRLELHYDSIPQKPTNPLNKFPITKKNFKQFRLTHFTSLVIEHQTNSNIEIRRNSKTRCSSRTSQSHDSRFSIYFVYSKGNFYISVHNLSYTFFYLIRKLWNQQINGKANGKIYLFHSFFDIFFNNIIISQTMKKILL